MHVTILTVGTQGDVRPFIALGRGLKIAGHDVRIAASPNFAPLIVRHGLEFALLSGDFRVLMARVQRLIENGTNPIIAARVMRRALVEIATPWPAEGQAACEGTDLIIASGLADLLGVSLAEAFGKQVVLAYLQPMLPSQELPPVTLPPRQVPLPGTANLLLHWVARVAQWKVLQPAFNRHVRPALGLRRYPWFGPRYPVGERACPVICGYSGHVVPRSGSWPEYVRVTGYWFLDEAESCTPPPAVAAFLDCGPAPIYIGFGSMRSRDPEATTRLVIEALRRSGQRALLATGWDGLAEPPPSFDDRICTIREVSHDWLFRQVDVAVHHGGAGTSGAAIRAGIPSVVVPFLADQPFWAWQMERLGVAPPRLKHKALTAEQLAEAITVARGEKMRQTARQLGRRIAAEDGVRAAIGALMDWGLLRGSC